MCYAAAAAAAQGPSAPNIPPKDLKLGPLVARVRRVASCRQRVRLRLRCSQLDLFLIHLGSRLQGEKNACKSTILAQYRRKPKDTAQKKHDSIKSMIPSQVYLSRRSKVIMKSAERPNLSVGDLAQLLLNFGRDFLALHIKDTGGMSHPAAPRFASSSCSVGQEAPRSSTLQSRADPSNSHSCP